MREVYQDIHNNANKLRDIISEYPLLRPLDPPSSMRTGIVAFTLSGENGQKLEEIVQALEEDGFRPAFYPLPKEIDPERSFVRLSPGPDLTSEDFSRIRDIFEGVFKDE